jgi:MFS family permease
MTRALTAPPVAAPIAPARSTSRVTLLALSTALAAFAMLQSLVSPVLPDIQRDLRTDQGTVTWVLTAWLLSAAVATPIMGRLGDMFGKKRTMLVALTALCAGLLVSALAPTVGVLIAGRVVQGLGGAVFPLAFGIVRDELPAPRVPVAIGRLSAVIGVGGGLGIVLAGPVVAALDWRWLFWVPLGVFAAVTLVIARAVPESPVRAPGRVNLVAAVLLAGWLVALLVPVSKAATWGWTGARVLVPLLLAVALAAAWVLVELRSTQALIDVRLMRLPAVWRTNLVTFLFGAGMFGAWAFLPQLVQTPASAGYGFGYTATGAGLLMLPMLVTMAVAGVLSGPLTPVLSAKSQLVAGAALTALACLALALRHGAPWQVAVATGVFGLGLGLVYAAVINLVVVAVPAGQTAVASGTNANVRTIGGAVGAAVMTALVTASVRPDGRPAGAGYTAGFLVLAAGLAVATTVATFVPARRSRDGIVIDR